MKNEERELIEKVIEDLKGTCQSLDTAIERQDLEFPLSEEAHAMIDEAVLECNACGWWVERSEESTEVPGTCAECNPDED